MLRAASRLPRRRLGWKQGQQLHRASLLLSSDLQCLTPSNYLQNRAQSSRSGGSSEVASSNSPAPLSDGSPSKLSGPSANSLSLRQRLRQLTLRISPSAQSAESGEGGTKEGKKRNSKYDRKHAKKQKLKESDRAAQKDALTGNGETMRKQSDKSRADINAQREEALKKSHAEFATWDDIIESESPQYALKSNSAADASKFAELFGVGKKDRRTLNEATLETHPNLHSVDNAFGSSLEAETRSEDALHEVNDSTASGDVEIGQGKEIKGKYRGAPSKDMKVLQKMFSDLTRNDLPTQGNVGSEGTENTRIPISRDAAPHLKLQREDWDTNGSSTTKNWFPRTNETQTELIRGASLAYHRRVEPATKLEGVRSTTSSNYLPVDQIPPHSSERRGWWDKEAKWTWTVGGTMSAVEVPVENVEPLRAMEVPQLAHGLDRVLFNPGVHWLRDVRSGIYNFEPRIQNLYDVDLFDYSALPPYQTSSIDPELAELVRRLSKKYSGSTSSMTSLLSHIYFLISAWKQPDLSGFSSGFSSLPKTYSYGAKLPAGIILRRFEDQVGDEVKVRYAIDAAKGSEGSSNNNYILMNLGKSMEKLLTSSNEEYQKYLRLNSHVLTQEQKERKEAYHYAATSKILMRSQLDCYDERLPRKTFDLKTRAVIAVRQDRANWAESSGYMIRHQTGTFESFEREMYDMTRSALLKYYFQARIGNMDGIMVAYHSTATVFGFQYLPCEDMAMKLFGSVEMGEQAFRLSVGFLERLLDTITDIKPDHSLEITLDTEQRENPKMFAFVKAIVEGAEEEGVVEEVAAAEQETEKDDFSTVVDNQEAKEEAADTVEPKDKEDSIKNDQTNQQGQLLQLDVQVDRYLSDELVKGPVDFTAPTGRRINEAVEDEISRRKRANLPPLNWSLEYSITPRGDLSQRETKENLKKILSRLEGLAPLILPNLEALNEKERMREAELSKDEAVLQKFYEDRRSGIAMGMPLAPGQVQTEGAILSVGTSEGEAISASADLKEVKEKPTQQWKKRTSTIERLRELARLGKEDKDREALTDALQVYERRGE